MKNEFMMSEDTLFKNGKVFREKFRYHHGIIKTGKELAATLRAGPYTDLGGYPLKLISNDGEALHFRYVKENFYQCVWSIRNKCNGRWRIIACDIDYENANLICAHCNEPIKSAYGNDPEEPLDDKNSQK